MTPLSPADQMFLLLEKRQQPMHVASLMLFSYPEDAGPKYVSELAEYLRGFQHPEPFYAKRLTSKFGQYYWTEDKHFDLEHHFRHEALPKPGRIRELLARVSAEHSNLMDRERPLWELHLIEGVRGRQFAIYSKMHHAMMDGVSGVRSSLQMLSPDPTLKDAPPWWAMNWDEGSEKSADGISGLIDLLGKAGKQVATLPKVAKELVKNANLNRKDSDHVSIFQAPHSLLNESITGSRRFAAQSYPLARLKKIGKAYGGTLNDVVLAICGSALRDYLISQHALPDKPLIAMVPMSVRNKEDKGAGNQVASLLINLGTHIADPALRMETIMASVSEAKERFSTMSPQEALNYTTLSMAPAGINMMTGILPKWQAFNVVISNVPGPRVPLYWNGAKLEGFYPVSIPMDHQALNITLLSRDDKMEFGLTACRRTLPSMQRLLDYIENGIHELEVSLDMT